MPTIDTEALLKEVGEHRKAAFHNARQALDRADERDIALAEVQTLRKLLRKALPFVKMVAHNYPDDSGKPAELVPLIDEALSE